MLGSLAGGRSEEEGSATKGVVSGMQPLDDTLDAAFLYCLLLVNFTHCIVDQELQVELGLQSCPLQLVHRT